MPSPRACGVDVESVMNGSTYKLAKRQIMHLHWEGLELAVHSHPSARLSHRSAGAGAAVLCAVKQESQDCQWVQAVWGYKNVCISISTIGKEVEASSLEKFYR